jgi:outer membrane murein-binding lipoprotein Lpp
LEKGSSDIYSLPDYTNAVAKLYDIDPISKGSNFYFGRKKDDGQIIYFPESYRIGYKNFLNGNQVWIKMDFLFLFIGLLSDGNWVFLPSYRDGINDARNELKFAMLAEGQRRIFEDNKRANNELDKQHKELEELYEENKNIKEALDKQRITADEDNKRANNELDKQHKELEELYEENKNIKEALDKQRITADVYRKEKDEMQRQLKEIQDRLSKMEHDTRGIMRKDDDKSDDLKRPVAKKRGAV